MTSNILRDYLTAQYRSDPSGAARFLSDACVIIRVRLRRWRGHRRVGSAKVTADGAEVGENTVTRPSWKLCPDAMSQEFNTLDREIHLLLTRRCLNRKPTAEEDEDDEGPALVGAGTYAVDSHAWPGLKEDLEVYRNKLVEAAARWCTEDGVLALHQNLKEQIGDTDYQLVKDLIPDAVVLQRKFGLTVRQANVRFVDDVGNADQEIVDMFEMAVRGPRETAATAWDALAVQLIDPETGAAFKPLRKQKDGTLKSAETRMIKGPTIIACARETKALARAAGRYIDGRLAAYRKDLETELTEDVGAAGALARKWNLDDAEAVRIGKMALTAATLARDETLMCEGFAAARQG